mmetsp:Transcript_13860/g.19851  ORF Transcript_13860/g.19851 Transcript_13860/m.19851 type:complete len:248 (+) Transcript_13860:60-803(+)
MNSIIETIRRRYSSDPLKERAALLNESIRNAMVKEIEEKIKSSIGATSESIATNHVLSASDDNLALGSVLDELNETLTEYNKRLKSLEDTESFVGARLISYKQRLIQFQESCRPAASEEEESTNTKQEDHTEGISVKIELLEGDDSEHIVKKDHDHISNEKLVIQMKHLQEVEQSHSIIVQSILQMKEHIRSLEHKIEEVKEKQRECMDFVQVVKDLVQQQGPTSNSAELPHSFQEGTTATPGESIV